MNDEQLRKFWRKLVFSTFHSEHPFSLCYCDWVEDMKGLIPQESLDDWLLDTGERTEYMQCSHSRRCRECGFLAVEEHHGSIVAVCPEGLVSSRLLSLKEATVMCFDITRLHRELACLIPGLSPVSQAPVTSLSWLIGQLYREKDEKIKNIFISYLDPPQLMAAMPYLLVASGNAPFLLFSPFHEDIPAHDFIVYRGMGIDIVSLRKHFTINRGSAAPQLLFVPDEIKEFPGSSQTPKNQKRIPLPPEIRWEDIHISFLDGHTVSCWIKGKNYTRTYYDFKMVNARNGQPDFQWKQLTAFSRNNGVLPIDWQSERKAATDQQRKYRLDMALRNYFGIRSPAISYSHDGIRYICNFHISDDADKSSIYHRKQRKT